MCALVICDLLIYSDAPRDQEGNESPISRFGEPYTVTCDSPGNPPPVCTWIRQSHTPVDYSDGSAIYPEYDHVINITSDANFTNNGCTLSFPRYLCNLLLNFTIIICTCVGYNSSMLEFISALLLTIWEEVLLDFMTYHFVVSDQHCTITGFTFNTW